MKLLKKVPIYINYFDHDVVLIAFVFPMIFYVSIMIGSVILIGIDYDFLFEAHAVGKSSTITVPRGAANPEVDITKLGPRQWFLLPSFYHHYAEEPKP